jgi:hypothetical protein
MKYKDFKKTKQCGDGEVFVKSFTDGITVEFKPACSYSDMSNSPTEWLTNLQTNIFR